MNPNQGFINAGALSCHIDIKDQEEISKQIVCVTKW